MRKGLSMFAVIGLSGEIHHAEAKNAPDALTRVRFDAGFRDAGAVFRVDIIRPGPRSRMEAVCGGLDPDNLETCRAPFIAFIEKGTAA